MSEQTKAPWAWQKFGKEWCLTGQHGMRPIILAVRKGALTSLVNGLLVPFDPAHPDARVMAASADLLAACKMAFEEGEQIYRQSVTQDMLRKAIQQTEGKA